MVYATSHPKAAAIGFSLPLWVDVWSKYALGVDWNEIAMMTWCPQAQCLRAMTTCDLHLFCFHSGLEGITSARGCQSKHQYSVVRSRQTIASQWEHEHVYSLCLFWTTAYLLMRYPLYFLQGFVGKTPDFLRTDLILWTYCSSVGFLKGSQSSFKLI